MKTYFTKPITHFLTLAFVFGFLFQGQLSAQVSYARAIKNKKLRCPSGSFFDIIDGGTCWSCPSGYKRTIFPVNGAKACERAARTVFKKAIDRGKGKGLLGTDCPKGAFFDPNGKCYSCPSGYKRTVYAVTSAKACSKRISAARTPAKKVSSLRCSANSFFDPIDGGTCWSCPKGYKRTVFPVNGAKACEIPSGDLIKRARANDIYKAVQSQKIVGGSSSENSFEAISSTKLKDLGSKIDKTFSSGYANNYDPQNEKRTNFPLDFMILVSESTKEIFISFGGSEPGLEKALKEKVGNWKGNTCSPRPLPNFNRAMGQPCWAGIAESYYSEVNRLLKSKFSGKKVYISGHSQGGAVSAYFTYLLLKNRILDRTKVHRLVTLSAPRFAPKSLQNEFERVRKLNAPYMTADALETRGDLVTLSWAGLGLAGSIQGVSAFGTIRVYKPQQKANDYHSCCTFVEKNANRLKAIAR